MSETCDGCGTTSPLLTYWCSTCSGDRRNGAVLLERKKIADWLRSLNGDREWPGVIADRIEAGQYLAMPKPSQTGSEA